MRKLLFALCLTLMPLLANAQINPANYSVADGGGIYGTDASGNIINWNATHWQTTVLGQAYQVGIGKNGFLWKLSTDGTSCNGGAPNKHVYYLSGTTWNQAGALGDCLYILDVDAN